MRRRPGRELHDHLADLPGVLTGWLGPLVESPRLLMTVMMLALVLIGTALDLTPPF